MLTNSGLMPCLGACVALGSPGLFELDGPLMTAFKEVRSGDCSAYAIKDYFDAQTVVLQALLQAMTMRTLLLFCLACSLSFDRLSRAKVSLSSSCF